MQQTSSSIAPAPTAVRRALLSVSDKTGIVELAQRLVACQVELLSTGGTYTLLQAAGLPVTEVSSYTGFPEIMEGRVKTLHPRVHGGILARRGIDEDVMATHGITPIDLVVVNLYPFAQAIAQPNCDYANAIENIDIGGPAMLRASAKNHAHVAVVCRPTDYEQVAQAIEQNALDFPLRQRLAAAAFEHTARYDRMIADYLAQQVMQTSGNAASTGEDNLFPQTLQLTFQREQILRYGENPHQSAAFYRDSATPEACVASSQIVQGKALSYNNLADADAALECVKSFADAACVIVKHANPCGVAVAPTLAQAYEMAYATDPESAFGGIIAFNRPLDAATARTILDRQFVEVIIAPDFAADALPVLASKPNIRVLRTGDLPAPDARQPQLDFKRIHSGILVQDQDMGCITAADLKVVTQRQPTSDEITDLLFAWQVAKYVKSNAIVYARQQQTVGIGAGQMSRVNSARIAAIKAEHAGLPVTGAVMASDAFFPFRDGIDNAAAVGIRAIIQPGGSMRDQETIAAADEHDIAMIFTGMRHFRH